MSRPLAQGSANAAARGARYADSQNVNSWIEFVNPEKFAKPSPYDKSR
jgi:hypothetical protein